MRRGSAMRDVTKLRPMPGWALCRMLKPKTETTSGLIFARDMEAGKTTEGVCEVLAVQPARTEDGSEIPPGFKAGDSIVFREFLKDANAVGHMVGESKGNRVFFLNYKDALAVIPEETSVTLGFWGEYSA